MVIAEGVRSLVDQQAGEEGDVSEERSAHFGLVGLTVGLAAAAFLTRNYDNSSGPSLQPSIGRVSALDGSTAPSLLLSGRF
jgi:hypothetical protein